MIRPATLPRPDAPSAPPSAPVDVWTWIADAINRTTDPDEQRRLVGLIETLDEREDEDDGMGAGALPRSRH